MSPTFPLEIFEIIISYVPDDSTILTSLALASPNLTKCSQAHLFSHFRSDRWGVRSISQNSKDEAPSHLDAAKFLQSIIINPQLAIHVREFVAPSLGSRYPQPSDEAWLPLLNEALPLMINLKSLSLFTYTKFPITTLLDTLVRCEFRLYELRWNWVIRDPDAHQQELMSTFLTTQSELCSLSLKMTPLPPIPRHALPKLETLATTCSNILTILPGRKVETLDCLYIDPDDPDFDCMTPKSPLATPFRNVKRLCLGISTMWFRNMEPYFPSLEVLQTSVAMIRDYHFIASNFPKLRTIHITRGASTNEQGMMAKWLFSSLPALETVLWGPPFASQSPCAQPRYDCWMRNSMPVFLDAVEVHERTGLLLIDKLCPI